MASRMGRYYQTNNENSDRTSRNQKLYDTLYSDNAYDDVETVVTKPSPNKIDIEKIRELLKSDEIKKNIDYKKVDNELDYQDPLDEEKSYDIRDVLSKARDERENEPSKYRSLRNTEYNILKGIKIDEYKQQMEEDSEELKELINTITSTSLLNKMGDRELSLELLNDLRSNTMIGDSDSIKAIIEEEKKEAKEEKPSEIDTSFYTSSLSFKDKDFEQLKDINNSIRKNNHLITTVLVVLIVVIIAVTAYVFFNLFI
ncbi:MAG: hypothetical protein PHD10_01190 [Bacilli bacterium]|nr:hypothetical protein [Bacilli bacterium]MDD4607736.1 hypothetical protein [Bacilli bacterium]